MADIRREGTLIEIDGKVRIEPGPVLVQAKATEELLDDTLTAEHYREGAYDAMAKPIELGKPMHYLDWNGHKAGTDGSTCFYVYQLDKLTAEELEEAEIDPKTAEPDQLVIWRKVGAEPTEDAAMGKAMGLLAGGA